MGLNWNEFSKKRWKEIMNGRTETLTPEQVAEFNKVRLEYSEVRLTDGHLTRILHGVFRDDIYREDAPHFMVYIT